MRDLNELQALLGVSDEQSKVLVGNFEQTYPGIAKLRDGHQPSKYQLAIYQHVQDVTNGRITDGRRHARIDALAGSGKSSTAKGLLQFIPHNQQILMTAFNKLIADSLSAAIGKLHPQVKAQTLHSLGFETLRMKIPGLKVNKYKMEDILQSRHFNMDDRHEKNQFFRLKTGIKRIVSLLKMTAVPLTEEAIKGIIQDYGIEIPGAEAQVINIVMDEIGRASCR